MGTNTTTKQPRIYRLIITSLVFLLVAAIGYGLGIGPAAAQSSWQPFDHTDSQYISKDIIADSSSSTASCEKWCDDGGGTADYIAKCKAGCKSSGSGGTTNTSGSGSGSSGGQYKTMEKIPGQEDGVTSLVAYLEALYNFGIATAAILALIMIGVGAFQYIVGSAGNAVKASDGKDRITSAIFGLILAMLVYLTFNLINPDLLTGTLEGTTEQEGYKNESTGEPGQIPEVPIGCNNKPELDDAINKAASAKGIDPNMMRAFVKCGEGCNPNVSKDGHASCGYMQAVPDIRRWCGIGGSNTESCKAIMSDPNVDMNCLAKFLKDDLMKRCGSDIRQVASCYNSGKKNNCQNTTKNYCDRIANCK